MTILLIIHITLMVLSVTATSLMVMMAVFGYGTPARFVRINFAGTMVGIGCGTLLLLTQPLDLRCMILVGYLFAFGLAYSFVRRKTVALSATQ